MGEVHQLVIGSRSNVLRGGGKPSYNEGMEQRVEKLEKAFEDIKDTLCAIRVDIADLKGDIRARPTTIQVAGMIIGLFAFSLALVNFAN